MHSPSTDLNFLPPHEPTPITGLHAYSHRLSVRPGDTMDVRISAAGPVHLDVVRYGYNRQDATVVQALGEVACTPQPIYRGDYIFVPKAPVLPPSFTLELWARILDARAPGALLSQPYIALVVEPGGRLVLELVSAGPPLILHGPMLSVETWHHLAASITPVELSLYLDGAVVATAPLVHPSWRATVDELLIGARRNARGEASAFFTGDLFGVAAYDRALPAAEIQARCTAIAHAPATGCLAHWAFDNRDGAPYRDTTGHGHDGQPVNYPTLMIPGPRFRTDADWQTFDPARDPDFGYAVRLFRDTLVDCHWPVTATWRVPEELASGQYAVRVTDATGAVRLVDVIVSPRQPRARLLCISTTNTRIAYNFECFRRADLDCGAYRVHPSYPLRPTMHGVRRPAGGDWYGHTVDFELPFYDWLDRQGIPYDVYTEWDVEEHPELLDAYAAIAIAGHSEYWTADFYLLLRRSVEAGRHLLLMSGNTGFWRVSLDRANQVIEIRKHERKPVEGTDSGPMITAAYYHQLDGRPGSYLHGCGYPVFALTGGYSDGWTDPPINGPRTGYAVLAPEHSLFHTPHAIDTRGEFAPKAAGYETDIAMRSVLERHGNPQRSYYPHVDGTPPPRLETAFDAGLQVLARATIPGTHAVFDYDITAAPGPMHAEMLYRRWPSGAIVFHAGSVLSAWPLRNDANYSRFMLNVLHAMGVEMGA